MPGRPRLTANQYQTFGGFNISLNSSVTAIKGIEVSAEMSKTGTGASCQIQYELSGDNKGSYTTGAGTGVKLTPNLTTTDVVTPLGGPTDLWNKTSAYWSPSGSNGLSNTNFWVRVTGSSRRRRPPARPPLSSGSTTCGSGSTYAGSSVVTNPKVFTSDTNVAGPANEVLTPRGFWGMMLSQGAESISGDAYLPRYDTDGAPGPAVNNPNYDQAQYYNYAVEMAPGSSNGGVWIYDPGFCAGALTTGLGDTWIGNKVPVSSFYDLYDTQGTPYDLTDDVLVPGFTSGNTFKQQDGSDPTLNGSGGSGIAGCDAYHLGWYQLGGASTLAGGKTYRLHTSTVDPGNASDQLPTNARNGWAIFSKATGTAPKIYGIGAMEMYSPLPSGASSTFYLAQIEAAHAGKTMEIKLFDAGDTNQDANIEILIPTAAGWSATNFDYTASQGTTNSGVSSCNSSAGTGVPNVVTYSGSSRFNGCWITINIPIPDDLHGAAVGLVEDQLQHDRFRNDRDRHHDLAGPDPGQSRPPDPALGSFASHLTTPSPADEGVAPCPALDSRACADGSPRSDRRRSWPRSSGLSRSSTIRAGTTTSPRPTRPRWSSSARTVAPSRHTAGASSRTGRPRRRWRLGCSTPAPRR